MAAGRITSAVRLLVLMLLSLWFTAGMAPALADGYKLAPLDKLKIRVVEWRADQGVSRDWSSIDGEYIVGPDGTLSLPYLGTVPVAGQPAENVAATIERELRRRLGLSGLPQASVSIAEYRPVFISGAVQKPGMYPYFPGMTVLKLLSVSGGFVKPAVGVPDTGTELIRAKALLDELEDERVGLLAKRARLEAEIARRSEIEFPESISASPAFASIAEGERVLKTAREDRIARQQTALGELKRLLQAELVALDKRRETLLEQERLAAEELAGIEQLARKKLTVNSQLRSIKQFVSQTQTNLINIESEKLRTRQAINKADRDLLSLDTDLKAELAGELQEAAAKLRVVDLKADLARDLMTNALANGSAGTAITAQDFGPDFTIVRTGAKGTRELAASETTEVQPGDVIKVELRIADGVQSN